MNPTPGSPVERALWFIESHLGRDVSLDQISEVACVSRYHMSRMFAVCTGIPVMRYLRTRRLSEAARALVNGAPDILSVALDVGYGSHEAFTRAFREQFGVTPESVRTQGHVSNLRLMEAMRMEGNLLKALEARFEKGRVLVISGIGSRYNCESTVGIAAQWQKFVPLDRPIFRHFSAIQSDQVRTRPRVIACRVAGACAGFLRRQLGVGTSLAGGAQRRASGGFREDRR
jgi:AraC-like DNA-binding protein